MFVSMLLLKVRQGLHQARPSQKKARQLSSVSILPLETSVGAMISVRIVLDL